MGKITSEIITSKNNQLIKDTKKLLTSSKARRDNGLFVLEGARLCFDVLNSVYQLDTVFVTVKAYDKYKEQLDRLVGISQKAYLIGEDVALKLSDTENTQGIFCVCKIMDNDDVSLGDKIIMLDNVSDPSNLGAIIRTAEALGINNIITFGGCDIFNPKALRASMGSSLRLGIKNVDSLVEYIKMLKAQGYSVYSTVPDGNAEKITDISFSGKVACVIGNEANGVSKNVQALTDKRITIPMLGRAESLNAGVAASITMWEMLR